MTGHKSTKYRKNTLNLAFSDFLGFLLWSYLIWFIFFQSISWLKSILSSPARFPHKNIFSQKLSISILKWVCIEFSYKFFGVYGDFLTLAFHSPTKKTFVLHSKNNCCDDLAIGIRNLPSADCVMGSFISRLLKKGQPTGVILGGCAQIGGVSYIRAKSSVIF